jgi:UDP-N-acetylglucosamine 2-epimerase (non-hydrolysing)
MKIMIVLGTRPEAIKFAPIILEAQQRGNTIQLIICSTGQHKEMLDQTLSVFKITPDIDLKIMQHDQTLASLTSRLIEKLDKVMRLHCPDIVLVQGDTTTAFTAGLVAFYLNIPIGHIEAGLRTGNINNPFPEEFNRISLSHIAHWNFAPTRIAENNLINESIPKNNIYLTGNTIVDAISYIRKQWALSNFNSRVLNKIQNKNLILITAHRRENFGENLHSICKAIHHLCLEHPHLEFIFPVHPNPQVRSAVYNELNQEIKNLHLLEPINFEDSLYLQSKARLIITDSGGIQEEAPCFATPVIVIREYTERVESIESGFSVLAGTSTDKIINATNLFIQNTSIKNKLASKTNPYGDGHAAVRILNILENKESIPLI